MRNECTIIQEIGGNDYINFDENKILLNIVKDTYEPIKIYKALVFMALSIIPESEIEAFIDAINWLKDTNDTIYDMHNYTSHVIEKCVAGAKPLPIRAIVGRRKPEKEVPYGFFDLEFDNYIFQVLIPCPREDMKLCGKEITFPIFPTIADTDGELRIRERRNKFSDWSSKEPRKGEKFEIDLNYDYRQEVTGRNEDVAEMARCMGIKPLK